MLNFAVILAYSFLRICLLSVICVVLTISVFPVWQYNENCCEDFEHLAQIST